VPAAPQVPKTGPILAKERPAARVRKLEAKGLLVVVVLILLYTVIRYWHNIPWSAR
jgi:hypothetical protein